MLQPNPTSLARLREALGGDHDLVECADWRALWDAVQTRGVAGCVVEVGAQNRSLAMRQLQRLRRRRPPLALVVEADFRGRELDLFGLGRIGVDGVLAVETGPGRNDVRHVVDRALGAALAARVTESLEGRLAEPGLEALRWAITHAQETPSVSDLAAALGRTPSVLARDLRDRRIPPARRLLLWGRLFQAARLMHRGDLSVDTVALRLGYSTRTALARALRRETGYPPTEVMRRGGVSCVLEGLLAGGRRGRRR